MSLLLRRRTIIAGAAAGPALSYDDEVLADSPALYWKLNEASGTTATDSSGNARNGTYGGTYTLATATGYPGSTTVPYFNGGGVLGNANLVSDGSFSIECWFTKDDFKTGQTADINALVGDLRSVSNGVLARWNGDTTTLTTYIANGGSYSTLTATTLEDTKYHYVLTSSGTTCRLYLNGSQVTFDSISAAGFDMTWTAARIWTGGGQSMFMMGSVGAVAVYPTELSAARVAAHYAAA